MTPEAARAAIPSLERALWEHNQRLFEAMRPGRRVLRWVGAALCLAGLALVLPYLWRTFDPLLVAYAAAMVGLLAVFVFLPELEPVSRRYARRSVDRAARRALEPVIQRAPYTISYLLGEGRIETTARDLGIAYTLELRGLAVAIVSDRIACVFKRRYSLRAQRIFYAPSDEELAALLAELAAAGSEIVHARPG